MSKNKTFRRLSSAALLSLAVYSQTVTPAWAKEVRGLDGHSSVRIERTLRVQRKENAESVGRGVVKSISSSSLIITREKDNRDFNVEVDSKTKFYKNISLNSIKEGHELGVTGKTLTGDNSIILAQSIRDWTVNPRVGSFRGKVIKIDGSQLVISVRNNYDLVIVTDKSKVVDRLGVVTDLSKIRVGDSIKAKGNWNEATKTLTSVALIRDLSLPMKTN
ncbi:MAG TPA: hypothetical protein VF837_05430 [Patescibacteria group bacterium]